MSGHLALEVGVDIQEFCRFSAPQLEIFQVNLLDLC